VEGRVEEMVGKLAAFENSLKKKALSHPFGKRLVSLFSPELNGQPAFKFDKNMDVICIYCMVLRTPGFLG
jgi:hypothetical protein